MSKALIKQLAQNARLRMTNSSYNETNKVKNNIVYFEKPKIDKNQIVIKKLDTSYEEIVKSKILNLLETDFDTLNPISQIIDYKYFNTLSESQKQKYILDISSLYIKMKMQYIETIATAI